MALVILQNTPKFFQNYVLVPENVHICPYLTFYNYNYVLFLINFLFYFLFNLLA
jgi:hypothetical protein